MRLLTLNKLIGRCHFLITPFLRIFMQEVCHRTSLLLLKDEFNLLKADNLRHLSHQKDSEYQEWDLL